MFHLLLVMNVLNVKITADDYGYSVERNEGIECAINNGVVNSVSVLVNGYALRPLTLNTLKEIRIGLHLNLTEGKPVTTNLESIGTLLNQDDEFFSKVEFQEKLDSFCEQEVVVQFIFVYIQPLQNSIFLLKDSNFLS